MHKYKKRRTWRKIFAYLSSNLNRLKAEKAFPRTVDMSNFRFLAERMSRALKMPILFSVLLLHERDIELNFILIE